MAKEAKGLNLKSTPALKQLLARAAEDSSVSSVGHSSGVQINWILEDFLVNEDEAAEYGAVAVNKRAKPLRVSL